MLPRRYLTRMGERPYGEDMTQATLPMNFSNARIELPAMWATVWVRGERGTVIWGCLETYAVPMIKVLFPDGHIGTHKLNELGR